MQFPEYGAPVRQGPMYRQNVVPATFTRPNSDNHQPRSQHLPRVSTQAHGGSMMEHQASGGWSNNVCLIYLL